jgi:DNA-binding XRE family transcriptional regulator
MAFTDYIAAEKIRDLREGAGYNSAEALAGSIKVKTPTADWRHRGTVDAWTIRMVERGHVPGPRIRYVLAAYFGVAISDIWQPRNWKPVDVSIATARKATVA